MQTRPGSLAIFAIFAGLVACSSSATNAPPTNPGGSGTPAQGTSGTDPGATGNPSTGGQDTGFKSYVILGDSISDQGGGAPFFYDLLVQNDDAKYPDWKGKDFKTRFGADIKVVKASKSGAVSTNLPRQAMGLPTDLPGPVLVTITIGGNDMQGSILDILGNRDQGDRDAFKANLDKTYDELTRADRFGAGVQVRILEASIYDPSDGNGDFKGAGCPAPLNYMDPQPTDGIFANWNGVVTTELGKYPSAKPLDAYGTFKGHGVSHLKDGTSWFADDCIHPSTVGHNELRKLFWSAVTGESS
jgi:lysophospholipase L1-like esterase